MTTLLNRVGEASLVILAGLFVAAVVAAYIAWVAILPSVGLLWLAGLL